MKAVLPDEQLEELAVSLRGTDDSLVEALERMGLRLRKALMADIEELLLDKEGTEQCPVCHKWVFGDLMEESYDDGERVCAQCSLLFDENDDDENEEDAW